LNSKLKSQEDKLRQEQSEIEDSLRQKLIKQKYQMKDLEERDRMNVNESTHLKI